MAQHVHESLPPLTSCIGKRACTARAPQPYTTSPQSKSSSKQQSGDRTLGGHNTKKKKINITLSDQRPQPLAVILARPHHYRRTASCDKLRRKKPNQIPTTQRPSHIARRWHLRWLRALQQRTIPNNYSSTQTRARPYRAD